MHLAITPSPGILVDRGFRQLEDKFADIAAYEVAEVHAYRGETDAAMEWLERAYSAARASSL
ncbi:MAG: hypothetical protein NVSMB15_02410 [Steroidobacteraceae bacterium]